MAEGLLRQSASLRNACCNCSSSFRSSATSALAASALALQYDVSLVRCFVIFCYSSYVLRSTSGNTNILSAYTGWLLKVLTGSNAKC